MAHVGDVHMQSPVPVLQFFDAHGVVEIARRLAVDGDDVKGPEIRAAGDLFGRDGSRNRTRLFQHVFRKAMGNMVRADQDLNVDPEVAGLSQDLDHAPRRSLAVLTKVDDLDVDDHAFQIFGGMHLDRSRAYAIAHPIHGSSRRDLHAFRNLNPLANARVVRYHISASSPEAKLADYGGVGAARHLDDFSFGLAVAILARKSDRRAIPMHHAFGFFPGQINIAEHAGHRLVRDQESKAIAVDADPPLNERRTFAFGFRMSPRLRLGTWVARRQAPL